MGIKRIFNGLNTEEAMPWQQELLQRIHLFDKDGLKTAVLLDRFTGKPAAENATGAVIPIEYFDPANEKALIDKFRQLHEKGQIEFTGFDKLRSYSVIIKQIRQQLIKERPPGYAFKPTSEEQVFLLKIFAELSKYNSITYWLTEHTDTNFICAYRHNDLSSVTDYERMHGAEGYYAFRNGKPIVGLTRRGSLFNYGVRFNDEFSAVVCEEVLHAYDCAKHISPRWIDIQHHIDELAAHVKRVQLEFPDLSADHESRFLRQRERTSSALLDPIPAPVHIMDRRADHALRMVMRNLDHAANFQKTEKYQNLDPPIIREEFFAKVGRAALLLRSDTAHIPTDEVRDQEYFLFNTQATREICDLLDQEQITYEQSRSYEEWKKAESFAWKVFRLPRVTPPPASAMAPS